MSISLISSVLWVPRGASAQHPRKFDLSDPAEFERIERLGKIKLEDARRELEELEKGVDGMQVDAEDDDGDGDGDEWESDSQSGSGSGSGSDSDPEAKARKMADKIKKGAGNDNQEEDEMAQYNLDTYDDNEAAQSSNMGIFSNIKGLSYYNSNDASQDPYITLENPGNEDATLEKEELEILPTDNLLVSAKTQDEVNMLEIHVWEGPDDGDEDGGNDEETAEGNLYVHHDTLLPAMPLCMEWGDCRPSTSRQGASSTSDTGSTSERGSFIAVGTLERTIEVWDLDVVEGMFPEAILGDLTEEEIKEEEEKLRQEEERSAAAAETSAPTGASGAGDGEMPLDGSGAKKKDKKKKKKKQKSALALGADGAAPSVVLPYAHTDSILSLSWNRVHRSLLASASADSSIKLWDLSSPTCQRALRSFTLHGESKVQSIQWSPTDPTVLLSGAWGGSMRIFDTRTPASALSAQLPSAAAGVRGSKKVNPDVEVLHWDPFATTAGGAGFYAATGNGQVVYYDARSLAKPLWTLDAHDGPCAALDVNEIINGCIVTGGTDKQTKVWNVQENAATGGQGISLVLSKDFGVGKVFTTLFSPDDPTTVALAGSAARLQVWDAFTNTGFRRVFGDRLRSALGANEDGAKSRSFAENSRRARGNGLVSTAPEEAGEEESDDE